ncbi:MAG: MFS transporter [Gaiellaceae bacterium]
MQGAIVVTAPDPRRWKALALVCVAFFMTVLDVSIVNVALPSIGEALNFSRENLQWVISAYAITFGGFLLLAGRAADLLGRRRVFMVGVALFTIASLVCGLANSEAVLIGSRAVQGLGAAIVSPAALSIITTLFVEGAERNKALGIWGAVGGSGAAVGVLAGGVLTKYLGWEWIFFVNVPVGVAVLALTVALVTESRIETARRRYDALGALTVTSGLALLVFTISKAPDVGWGSARTIGLLTLAVALLATFLVIEMRVPQPLMPLRIFQVRTVTGANIVGLILGGVVFANFFLLTLYVQQVLGYSALKAGLTFLATAGTAVLSAGVAQALVTKVGVKPILATGLVLMTAGMLWYTQISVDGSYATDLLPGYIAIGIGLAFSFVPVTIAALAGVAEHEAGLGSGLINTSQQIGGAIGVAVASTIFTSHFTTLLSSGTAQPAALTHGFQRAFWFLAVVSAVGIVATLVFVSDREVAPVGAAEPEPSR